MNLRFGQIPRFGMVAGQMPTFALVGALLAPVTPPTPPDSGGSGGISGGAYGRLPALGAPWSFDQPRKRLDPKLEHRDLDPTIIVALTLWLDSQ